MMSQKSNSLNLERAYLFKKGKNGRFVSYDDYGEVIIAENCVKPGYYMINNIVKDLKKCYVVDVSQEVLVDYYNGMSYDQFKNLLKMRGYEIAYELPFNNPHSKSLPVVEYQMVAYNSRLNIVIIAETFSLYDECTFNTIDCYCYGTSVFDNMKAIVNHAKSSFRNVILNSKAEQYAKDAGFKIRTCLPYKPRTKGKVETLAKIMNRLKAFDGEFENLKELEDVVTKLNYSLNNEEKSQAIDDIPYNLFQKEKEYLIPVNIDILKNYYIPEKTYKVSNESMITYKGIKYSVPIQYVGKQITVLDEDNVIHLYYNAKLIYSYNKNKKYKYNYKEKDYIEILKHSSFDYKTDQEIKEFIEHNLKSLDNIYIEKGEKND